MTHETTDNSSAQTQNDSGPGSAGGRVSFYPLTTDPEFDWLFRGDTVREHIMTDCAVEVRE